MSKLIKWGLLGVLAIALLIKLSLWLSVRSIMADASTQLSPLMTISYGGITSSFDGRVGLEKVRIAVPAMRDSLQIEHAELKFNGLGDLLSFKERLAAGKFPEQLAVNLKGLTLEAHGPFMQQLYDTPAPRSLFTSMGEVVCGKVQRIRTVDLLDMGYRTLETDGQFSYRFQPGAQKLSFNLTSDTRDMGELRLSFTVANMPERPVDLRLNPPRVERVVFELSDNQYQRKVQNYCAGKEGLNREEYLQAVVDKFDRVLRSQRVALNQSMLDAYARYQKDPQSLRIELEPTEGMVWDGLQFFGADDVLTMLRPVVLVNQEAVQSLEFAWVDPRKRTAADQPDEATVEAVPVVASGQERFVQVAGLGEHIGKRLRFVTYDGMYYQGVLTRVNDGKAYLSVRGGNGSAEMSLRLERINSVKVQF